MRKVFVDSNVILDVLLLNDGFWQDSYNIFKLAELGQIKAFVSASSMTDVFYISKKRLSLLVARQAMADLLKLFEVVSVDGEDLNRALTMPIADFEDALQARCAEKANADVLITRDVAGFAGIDIGVTTPADFEP